MVLVPLSSEKKNEQNLTGKLCSEAIFWLENIELLLNLENKLYKLLPLPLLLKCVHFGGGPE